MIIKIMTNLFSIVCRLHLPGHTQGPGQYDRRVLPMTNYHDDILHRLLDKYEKRKSFAGTNTVNQSFSLVLSKAYPEYTDDSCVAEIRAVETAAEQLTAEGLADLRYRKNGLLEAVTLRTDRLEDLNILRNPGHVFLKGNAVLTFNDPSREQGSQTLDLSALSGDIAISSTMLKDIRQIKVPSKRVVTIENLTAFNAYAPGDELVLTWAASSTRPDRTSSGDSTWMNRTRSTTTQEISMQVDFISC